MKKYFLHGVIFIFTILVLVGCGNEKGPDFSDTPQKQQWSTTKSPITGRCYEVLTTKSYNGNIGYGFMGMSEIPCSK